MVLKNILNFTPFVIFGPLYFPFSPVSGKIAICTFNTSRGTEVSISQMINCRVISMHCGVFSNAAG